MNKTPASAKHWARVPAAWVVREALRNEKQLAVWPSGVGAFQVQGTASVLWEQTAWLSRVNHGDRAPAISKVNVFLQE